MNCPHCNKPDPGTGKFCIHCGKPLSATPAVEAFPFAAPAPTPSEPAPSWPVQPVVQSQPGQQPVPPPVPAQQPAPGQLHVSLPYNPNIQRVEVVDVNMTFQSMVVFMVKWSIAAIPAALILLTVGGLLFLVFGALLGGCTAMLF